jgi:putative oxidoreductase
MTGLARPHGREALATLSRLVLGGLFLWAAANKVGDMARFAEEVADYQLLPAPVVPWAAALMPGIEVLAGLLLVAGVWARPAALVLSVLLVVFIGALSQSLLRGIDLRCGCFGGSDVATWGTVWRDAALLALGVAVLWLGPGRFHLGNGTVATRELNRPKN